MLLYSSEPGNLWSMAGPVLTQVTSTYFIFLAELEPMTALWFRYKKYVAYIEATSIV
jgi:hypothetical protein